MTIECRTASPLAPALVARAQAAAAAAWPTVEGESSTVATEIRHCRARAAFGTATPEEADVLRAEGYSYLVD